MRILLLSLLLLGPMTAVCDQEDPRLTRFDALVREYRVENDVLSLSYAIVRDGEILALEGIGWQDHDAEEPTTADTSYLAASITKTFTGTTLMAMDADGHIDLDDAFTSLSDWPRRCAWLSGSGSVFGGGTATTSGYIPPAIDCEAEISVRHVLQMRVLGEPGSNFLYNPVVFGRLANWVEERTGRPYRDWVRHYVIEPAKLTDTAAGWRDPNAGNARLNIAPPFRHAPEQDDNLAPSVLPNTEMNASSGIIGSAGELARYAIALDAGDILDPDLLRTMWTPPLEASGEPASYAYGWWVQTWQGHKIVWHGGWWPDAYAGLLLKVPEQRLGLVLLGNTDGLNWPNRLHVAEVEKHSLARAFLEMFVE